MFARALDRHYHKQQDLFLTDEELKDVDIIYHLAAYSRVQGSDNPDNMVFENNVSTLKESLELARQTGAKLVFTSTSYCTADPHANYYSFSKYLGEQLCGFYREKYSVKAQVVRLFNVYGVNGVYGYHMPEWKLGVVDKFLLDKEMKRGYIINNGGEQTRDYIHVSDVCDGLIKIGTMDTELDKVYEIGTGKQYSVNQIADFIFDTPPQMEKSVSGEIQNSVSLGNIELTKSLGWKPGISLEGYLERSIE